ncbi:MAG: class I SAM-dependent methyltransferase [Caldilineaceae bacterium]|nr:class I SAM-dependent methyltransferase [Caldilineaceae bacterium]
MIIHAKQEARIDLIVVDSTTFDVGQYNRKAWDAAVDRGSPWTIPVGADQIADARRGEWQIVLTPTKPVPRSWFPSLRNARILCLASGGGQQGPILAAAGAAEGAFVTVFDNSPAQLARDRAVADQADLPLITVDGDMRDLSIFADGSFDLIVHPCSNLFVPDVRPVWAEARRVLREGGVLLAGFPNPIQYIFDQQLADEGTLHVRHSLPYSDLTSIEAAERDDYIAAEEALEFGHTLTDQIGGQIDAGFVITGFYEDRWPGMALAKYTDTYMATRGLATGER